MNANRNWSGLSWLVVLLMPLFLMLNSLYLFMTPGFIRWQYSQSNFPQAELFTSQARAYNATETVEYVWGNRTLAQLEGLGVYNAREIKHLVDVQNVARGAIIVHAVSALAVLLSLIVLLWNPATRLLGARSLVSGAALTLVIMLGIGLFAAFAFDQFFVTFHHLFFEGDTWLFPDTDALIQFYPLPFWETAAYGMTIFIGAEALIVAALGWGYQRQMLAQARLTAARASS
jgi:integral membrane protein (TIGR01906 family)